MKEVIHKFNLNGYDPYLDVIKAYAIVCVLIGHTFPYINLAFYGLWAGMQVPLFILVQTFHGLKSNSPKIRIKKIWWRVVVPFFITQLTLILVLANTRRDFSLVDTILGGGAGPGSYYPWIYVQIALLLPLVGYVTHRINYTWVTIVTLVICEGLEIMASIVDFPDYIYRLLCIRYFLLLYLGWRWVTQGILINKKTLLLSLLSLGAILYFEYVSKDDEPFFYETAWKFHRWPCYFYVAYLGVFLLCKLYDSIKEKEWVVNIVRFLAKISYEIFLVQMFVIAVLPTLSTSLYIQYALKIIIVFIVSIFGGYYYHKFLCIYIYINSSRNGLQKNN